MHKPVTGCDSSEYRDARGEVAEHPSRPSWLNAWLTTCQRPHLNARSRGLSGNRGELGSLVLAARAREVCYGQCRGVSEGNRKQRLVTRGSRAESELEKRIGEGHDPPRRRIRSGQIDKVGEKRVCGNDE